MYTGVLKTGKEKHFETMRRYTKHDERGYSIIEMDFFGSQFDLLLYREKRKI